MAITEIPASKIQEAITAEEGFFRLLTHYPFLAPYWMRATMTKKHFPRKSAKCDLEGISKAAFSSDQRLIANVLLSIWDRDSDFAYDVVEISALDMRWKKPILQFMVKPF